ncbi:tryptophan synthase subunit alpha, partial [Bacteroides fragilis]|nr:tryptophan synthase subunit alpha [Bacteroides fragilis]
AAAEKAGVDPIFIAPAQASEKTLAGVAKYSKGYIYAIAAAEKAGVDPIFIAPAQASEKTLAGVAKYSKG